MGKREITRKEAMMSDLRIAEERWLEERALRLIKYRSIFFEESIPLNSTASILFYDEIMHDFVYGAYVSCIVMCHMTIMEILKSPFSHGTEEKIFKYGFNGLIMESEKRGWLDDKLNKDLKRLNRIRNNLEHSKSPREVVKRADKGDYSLAELYHPSFYSSLEKKAIFAMRLLHRVIWDVRLRFAPPDLKECDKL